LVNSHPSPGAISKIG